MTMDWMTSGGGTVGGAPASPFGGAPAQSQGEQLLTGFQPKIDEPSGADFGDTPLSEWIMVGAGYEVRGGTGKNGRPWQRVAFKGNEVEVITTDEPWPHPTMEFSIFYNDPAKTPKRRPGQGTNDWEVFSGSLREIYGAAAAGALDDAFGGPVSGEGSQPAKPGRKIRLKKIPTLLRVGPDESSENPKWRTEWHDEIRPAIIVAEVEGVGKVADEVGFIGTPPAQAAGPATGTTTAAPAAPTVAPATGTPTPDGNALLEYVLGLADGKVPDKFYEVALDDAEVMKHPQLVTALTSRDLHTQMINLGRLSQDTLGILHRVQA